MLAPTSCGARCMMIDHIGTLPKRTIANLADQCTLEILAERYVYAKTAGAPPVCQKTVGPPGIAGSSAKMALNALAV